MPTFDIIITSWERLDYLKRTIASLIVSCAWKEAQRIIIVDNCSTDPKIKEFLLELQKQYNNLFLVFRPHNDGWGMAVNDALGLSRAEYLLISNNDVEYAGEFYTTMLKVMSEPRVLPKDRNEKGIGILAVWAHTAHSFVGIQQKDFREMDQVPAVGWMLSKRAMMEVGMLPEHGPCLTKGGNGEDVTYVIRMKQAGYLVGVPAHDLATHITGY